MLIDEQEDYYGKDVHFSTEQMLFFLGGSFSEMSMYTPNPIGIGKDIRSRDKRNYENISMKNLEDFGMIPEILRRAPMLSILKKLTEDDLARIMKYSGDSPIRDFRKEYHFEDVKLTFTNAAVQYMAKRAYNMNLGATALNSVCHDVMREIDFILPNIKNKINHIKIDEDVCRNPIEYAQRLLKRC